MHLTSGTKPEEEEAARTTFKEKEAIWKERNEQRKAGREEEREKVAKPKSSGKILNGFIINAHNWIGRITIVSIYNKMKNVDLPLIPIWFINAAWLIKKNCILSDHLISQLTMQITKIVYMSVIWCLYVQK